MLTLKLPFACLALAVLSATSAADDAPPRVEVVRTSAGFELLRDGDPFFVRGVGGPAPLDALPAIGGNAVRTWGAQQLDRTHTGPDGVDRPFLDHCHHLGLAVAAGFWMEHPRHGLDYDDRAAVEAQLDRLERFVRRHKDHPAILLWGIGNEVEIDADPARILRELNAAAKRVKAVDPNHPTMIVLAELGANKAELVMEHCPDVDILGVNSYGGVHDLGDRLAAVGFDRPYIVTEYGPLGHWETGQTAWGAPYEQTSTQKAEFFRKNYASSIAGHPGRCLGGFAFLWGHKQETTATWYGMFLDSGERLAIVDELQRAFTGRWPADRAPAIDPIRLDADPTAVAPGQRLDVRVAASDPDGDRLSFEWIVRDESTDRRQGGDREAAPPERPGLVAPRPDGAATLTAPADPGPYRLFVTVRDGRGRAATANIPFRVVAP